MSKQRREPPLHAAFLGADGKVLSYAAQPGAAARREPQRKVKDVPRAERRAVVLCRREHLLAVVRHDGLLVMEGRDAPGWVLLADGWAPLVEVGQEGPVAGPVLPEPVQFVCVECGFLGYELAAADVPARGSVVARLHRSV